ncbi:MAG: sulfotransferase [Promethearchaeota archaeon]
MLKYKQKSQDLTEFPMYGYAWGYIISKFFDSFKSFSYLLDKCETRMLNNDISKFYSEKPIYITGLTRAGTTIILEMLHKHPDLASHRYKHFIIPYTPHWIGTMFNKKTISAKSFHRLHKDGILVTYESPEAIEEIFWQKFFKGIHNENTSNILSANVSNPDFEKFYINHTRKLIFSQQASRYLAKNNYNITRMEYLLRLFPYSKFLVIIRNPVDQIASLIKQTRLFKEMERENPFLKDWLRIIGHHEFGHNQVCINVGNMDLIYKIRNLWRNKKTYVKGWAYYWSSIYDFVANLLDKNEELKKATLIVSYDELCETPGKIIDQILEHTKLPTEKFEKAREYYLEHLHKPTYYTPDFSKQELTYISEVTKTTVARYGLNMPKFK